MKISEGVKAQDVQLGLQPPIVNQVPPEDPPFNFPNLAETGEAIISTLIDYGNQVRDKLTQAFDDFRTFAREYAISQAAWQTIPDASGLEGLTQGASNNDSAALETLQRFLVGAGYMPPPESHIPPYTYGDNFGGTTANALRAFQADRGIETDPNAPATVTAQTVTALQTPIPRLGYTQNSLDGSTQPEHFSMLGQAGDSFANQLGNPLSAATVQEDGSVTQYFENGTVTQNADGSLSIADKDGNVIFDSNSETVQANYQTAFQSADNHLLSQFESDYDTNGKNNNCGFASLLMSASFLGSEDYQVASNSNYAEHQNEDIVAANNANRETIMALRAASAGGDDDSILGTPNQIAAAAETIPGLDAEILNMNEDNRGMTDAEGIDYMKLVLMSGEPPTAFVVAGNPATGWSDLASSSSGNLYQTGETPFNGSHFVSVVGYNPATDSFLVLDPLANEPIEISTQQMQDYMSDGGTNLQDITQLTYTPPSES